MSSSQLERRFEREGRTCVSRQIQDLKGGDLVQHYSTWEQTYGDAMRRLVEKVDHVPFDDAHRLLITWRDPLDDERGTYQTREARETQVDVVVGFAPKAPRALTLYVAVCSTAGCKSEPDGDGAECQPTPEKAIAAAVSEAEWNRMYDGRLLCENCWTAEDPELADDAICGRLLVGQGSDVADPLCAMAPGHVGPCKPEEALRGC